MKVANLQFLLLCNAASSDSAGKVSVLGIFSRVLIDHFPGKFSKFSIVACMSFQDQDTDAHVIEAKIFAPDTPKRKARRPLFTDSITIQGSPPFNEDQTLNIFCDVTDLKLPRIGKYVVRMYFDGEEFAHTTFYADEKKKRDQP